MAEPATTRSRLGGAVFFVLLLASLHPAVSGAVALAAGLVLALTLGHPFGGSLKKWTTRMLAISIVGLGAKMNLEQVAAAGLDGIGTTAISIALCFVVGIALTRLLRVPTRMGLLLTTGTAICGGSAIAAAAPVLGAQDDEISVPLAVVFVLNALALILFPWLGGEFGLGQEAFGWWAAIAIHDTSSVVGAGVAFGERAAEVATTVKLARALWIVPVCLALGFWHRRQGKDGAKVKAKKPWFILGFIIAAALVTYVPVLQEPGAYVAMGAKRLLVATLFLIGTGLTAASLKRVGLMPLVQGVVLWLVVATASLFVVQQVFVSG